MGQDSALSSILSALYIASLIHIFEHRAQALFFDFLFLLSIYYMVLDRSL